MFPFCREENIAMTPYSIAHWHRANWPTAMA